MRSIVVLLLSLAVTSLVSAQSPQVTKDPSPDIPTFRSRSDLVFVPVIVKDKKGRHLAGLKQESFSIEQDGKPVRASVFEEVRHAGDDIAPPMTVPGLISNYTAGDERPKRMLIVMLDLLNTPLLYQSRAKYELLRFLETAVPPDEPVALFGLGRNGLRQLHAVTTNAGELIASIKNVRGRLGPADDLARSVQAPSGGLLSFSASETRLQDFLQEAESRSGYNAFVQRQVMRLTLLSFQQLANAYAAIPGRKAIVWVTGGFPFLINDPSAFMGKSMEMIPDFDRTWRVLTNSNLAVYPIDALGMVVPGWEDPGYEGYDRQRHDTMRAVADATGGMACVDSNDLQRCFRRAGQDSESYYLLGYYLQGELKRGWHKLNVKIAGPHGEVRARQGFYFGETPKQLEKRRLEDMYIAVASPVDYTGVHFSIRQPHLERTADGKTQVSIDVLVPGKAFRISPQQQNQLDLDVLTVGLGDGGKVEGFSSHNLRGNPSDDSAARIEDEGLRLTQTISLRPGKYTLRVAVRDNQTGQIGTVQTSIAVN